MRSLVKVCLVVGLFAAFAVGQAAWTPELQVKTKALGTPRVSPDGSMVAYTVNDAVMTADKSEFVTQIWLASIDGKRNDQITFADKTSTNPRWSPDGKWLAFTSTRKDNKSNIYLLRVSGGEAEMVTDVKSGVTDFQFSPDGNWIAFTMNDPKSDDEEKNDKARNDFRWVDENAKLARLYVMPVAKDANGKREHRKLTTENRHVTGFNWSPDGTKIAFSHVSDPKVDYWPTSDVSIVDVAGGSIRPLAATAAAETSPTFSPDGNWIAISASELPTRWAASNRIHVFPTGGGTARVMPMTHDGQPGIVGWIPKTSRLYFIEAKGTGTSLYDVDVNTSVIREISYQNAVLTAVNLSHTKSDGHAFGWVRQTAAEPPEVWAGNIGQNSQVKISSANADVAKMPVGKTELIKWKSKDGREIEGLLTYPTNYVAGTKVPLLLNIHGGPAGVFQQNYIGGRGAYPLATFASRGYAILRPNPRGSSGYGTKFRQDNIKDWGFGDYEDLMTGVDKVIDMGVADANRLGVMGWSYGGYMTPTIVTKTNRFKAASAGAPVTNLMSFNGTADIPAFIPDYFGGQSWEIPEVYAKHSAMFNVKGVKTPTMIQHGEADVRVPISQGYEFYNALKQQGVPTRMIVLPRQPHGPNEPKMQVAAMQSNLDWFEKYLK